MAAAGWRGSSQQQLSFCAAASLSRSGTEKRVRHEDAPKDSLTLRAVSFRAAHPPNRYPLAAARAR